MSKGEIIGQLLHGTARAWRQKLDQRLKPMGLSQAKWRTLMHLSLSEDALTQAEIAARLGVAQIKATADELRHELLAGIPEADLQTCMNVLVRIGERAEKNDRHQEIIRQPGARGFAEHNGQPKQGRSIPGKSAMSRRNGRSR
jgi:hypothetical protein